MSEIIGKYINPLTDFGFKKLFGSEPNKILLIDFLNQILPEKRKIKDLSYTSNEILGQTAVDRKAIFDLNCISESGERFIVEMQKVYIELPKFSKKESELKTQFDKWLYVFTHLAKLNDRPKKLQNKIFSKLFEAAEIAKFSHEERKAYQDSLKHYRDIKNIADTSFDEGIEEGVKKVAEKLIDMKLSVADICKATGLTKEEVKALIKKQSGQII